MNTTTKTDPRLLGLLDEMERRFPIRFIGTLSGECLETLDDPDGLELVSQGRPGLTLFHLGEIDDELSRALGRSVRTLTTGGLKGPEAERVLSRVDPL